MERQHHHWLPERLRHNEATVLNNPDQQRYLVCHEETSTGGPVQHCVEVIGGEEGFCQVPGHRETSSRSSREDVDVQCSRSVPVTPHQAGPPLPVIKSPDCLMMLGCELAGLVLMDCPELRALAPVCLLSESVGGSPMCSWDPSEWALFVRHALLIGSTRPRRPARGCGAVSRNWCRVGFTCNVSLTLIFSSLSSTDGTSHRVLSRVAGEEDQWSCSKLC